MLKSVLFALLFALSLVLLTAQAQERDARVIAAPEAKVAVPVVRADDARPAAPATRPSPATDLAAGKVVQASAACCFTQCPSGGNCGNKCKVVDAASQCDRNLVFECSANTGLNCFGGKCTCQ